MTKRATFSQAELQRAMRAAAALGKVAVWIPGGIAFVESDKLPLSSPTTVAEGAQTDVDRWFAENG